jgi:isoleucyl-tRNA synthetase
LSFTTEEIYKLLNKDNESSIHLKELPKIPSNWKNEVVEKNWTKLIKIRNSVNGSIEVKRSEKLIGSSLEATIKVKLDNNYYNLAKKYDFSEICITSGAEIILDEKSKEEIKVETFKAQGKKCDVCWKISKEKCDRHGHLK